MKPIIRVENLSKQYRIGANQASYSTLRDSLANAFTAPFRRFTDHRPPTTDHHSDTIWALKDINFEVQPGEVVGIIGRNGAGKSTLLKILSRITEPNTGKIDLHGRVSSLLEVGTGFHPELTGRENIYLNGAVLGMKRAEITRKFDEIVAFAEVEKFLDTPVKHYSSGMYMRLAFAVAAHLEPEIMVVDEVLAVGDANFQKKCLGKMKQVADTGRTVLFVSHNMTALQSLCDRVIWLDNGRLTEDNSTSQVIAKYLQTTTCTQTEQIWSDPKTAPGNEYVKLRLARLTQEPDNGSDILTVRSPLKVEFEYWNYMPEASLNLSLHLYNIEGTLIFNTFSNPEQYTQGLVRGSCSIPGNLLNDGTYRIMIMIVRDTAVAVYMHEDILVFEINDVEREVTWYGKWAGAVRPNIKWVTGQLVNKSHAI